MKLVDVNKVPVGVKVVPEIFKIFRAGATLFQVNISQFLTMAIHRRNQEGFVYYDVDPKYGEICDNTKQTIFYLSEEYRDLLQQWADRDNCSMSSVVRCLMDITVKNMIAYDKEVRDSEGRVKPEFENKAKIEIIETLEQMGVSISGYIDELMEEIDFKNLSMRKTLKLFTPSRQSIFDYKVTLSDKQLSKLKSISNRQKIEIECVKQTLEFCLFTYLVKDKSTYCHVSKEQFTALKHICQNIGFSPSKLLNEKVTLLNEPKYHSPELPSDVELLRINAVLEKKTSLVLERYCKTHRVKMAEAVRTLVNCINNYFEQEGVKIPEEYVF